MLIFVSDLHLVDSFDRVTLDSETFLRELKACVALCAPGECPTLVLLGDIFELLKSSRWLTTGVRPWHPVSQELKNLTVSILQGIYDRNPLFFEGLNNLHRDAKLQLVYVPGNHDGLLSDEGGAMARALLRRLLPVQGRGEEPFDSDFQRAEYGVYAEHGHEFDDFNRRDAAYPRFVPGDVVVIELVTQLPYEAARHLGVADPMTGQFDVALGFLQDLDDVLPQDAGGLLSWVRHCLDAKPDNERQRLQEAVLKGLNSCLRRAAAEAKNHGPGGVAMSVFVKAVETFVDAWKLGAVAALAKIEPDRANEVNSVTASAQMMARAQTRGGRDTFLFVAGHTHLSMHHPIAVGAGHTITYLNSGTWRRVLMHVSPPDRISTFAAYHEATVLCVHRRKGSLPPAYEFRRQVSGV
jgi:UDP-2,3-diacylglucosamine pyrophosphatase LpxH